MFNLQSNLTIFLGIPGRYHLVAHSHTGFFEWFLLTDSWVGTPYSAASLNFEGLVKAINYTNWNPFGLLFFFFFQSGRPQ